MDEQPLSQQYLNIVNSSVIAGSEPRDSETRPHVRVSYDDQALTGTSNTNSKPIGIIGPADDGRPNHVYRIDSVEQAKNIFGGGDLLTAIELAWQPQNSDGINGGVVYAERVQDADRATLSPGALHFTSTKYGTNANNTAVKLSKDPLTNTWNVEVKDRNDGYDSRYTGIGKLALIHYIPNSWDKYHIPEGQKDYARASMRIEPLIKKDIAGNIVKGSMTGEAARLVINIHDTRKPGILYNNITNNLDDNGSRVYESNDTELEMPNNAQSGDLNPDRGPFENWSYSLDLTDNDQFPNVTALLSYLQSINHIEVQLIDDHHISHISPRMLDLTVKPVNLIGRLDNKTLDNSGNIVEPGSIWSTLGDLVDKLRYDSHVNASADMRYQLRYISTLPSGASHYVKLANSYGKLASSASAAATSDSAQAYTAFGNNAPELGSEYKSVADSYTSLENEYASLERVNGQFESSAVNADTSHITSADSSAAQVAASASTTMSELNSAMTSLQGVGVRKTADFNGSSASAAYTNYSNLAVRISNAQKDSENSDIVGRKSIGARIQNAQRSNPNNNNNAVSDEATSLNNSLMSSESVVQSSIADLQSSASSCYQQYMSDTYLDYVGGTIHSAANKEYSASASANSLDDSLNSSVGKTLSQISAKASASSASYAKKAGANTSANSASYSQYTSLAQSAAIYYKSLADSAANSSNNNIKPVRAKIASYNSVAASYANIHNNALSSLSNLRVSSKNASLAVASAENAANREDASTFADAESAGNYVSDNKRLKAYTNNLLDDIRKAVNDNADNVVEGDLDALSKVAQQLGTPSGTMSVVMYKAGRKMMNDLNKALNDRAQMKQNLEGSNDNFRIDLGHAASDLNGIPEDSPVPTGIFTTNSGEGQINVLGEPIHAFDFTHLSGGYTSPIPVDWSDKFKYFDDTNAYDMVALSPQLSVQKELSQYIGDRYNASHNMRGFVGGGYNYNVQHLITDSAELDSERMCLIGTSGYYTPQDGINLHIPAYETAALVAGIDSSLPAGQSILNQKIDFNKVDQHFSSTELDALDTNGVITANPVVNRGSASEYTISDDVTTSNDHSDPIKSQLGLGETTDFLFDDLRTFLHQYIGMSVTASSAKQLQVATNTFLHDKVSDDSSNLIVNYLPDDTYCEIHNESAYITFTCVPTMPLKWINVTGIYNGLDEQYGGADQNNAGFTFIDAKGNENSNQGDIGNGNND